MNTNPYLRLLLIVLADGSTEVSHIFGNEEAQTFLTPLRGKDLRDEVSNLLEVLDDRERKIILQRFALDGGKSKTLEEVAKKFGFTRKRIRQLQNIALAKLRLRIQSDPTLHRILVVFVMGLVLRIKEQPFLVKPIPFPRLIRGIEESQSKTGVKKWQG
jgi:DNA-binding CsgD family transcriptional regulator